MAGLRRAVRAHPLPWLVALSYAFAWALLVPAMLGARHLVPLTVPGFLLIFPLGYTPAAAALLVAWLSDGRAGLRAVAGMLGRWRIPLRYYVAVVAAPPALFLLGLGLGAATGVRVGTLGAPWLIAAAFVVNLVVCAAVNGEEIAWRGVMLPMLQARTTALRAGVLIGVLEAVFHLPLFLTPGTPQSRIPFQGFLLFSVALAVLFTFVYNATGGSLLAVTLLHGAINASTNVLPVPSDGPVFWLIVLLTAALATLVALASRGDLLASRTRYKWRGRDIGADAPPPVDPPSCSNGRRKLPGDGLDSASRREHAPVGFQDRRRT
jgi:membrane protease YdiL (CAAX protease family)